MEQTTRWETEDIQRGARALNAFLDGQQRHQDELLEILDHHLTRDPSIETVALLYEAIEFYANEEFAPIFIAYLTWADLDEELRTRIQGHVSEQVAAYLRKTLAMHGARVTEATYVSGESPNAWRSLNREVYFDLISEQWRVRIEIGKYDGQTVLFDETPNSTMVLTHAMLDTLLTAVERSGLEELDPATIEPLRMRMDEFLAMTNDIAPGGSTRDAMREPSPEGTYL